MIQTHAKQVLLENRSKVARENGGKSGSPPGNRQQINRRLWKRTADTEPDQQSKIQREKKKNSEQNGE